MEKNTTTQTKTEAYVAPAGAVRAPRSTGPRTGGGGFRSGGGRAPRSFAERPKPEFDQKILDA